MKFTMSSFLLLIFTFTLSAQANSGSLESLAVENLVGEYLKLSKQGRQIYRADSFEISNLIQKPHFTPDMCVEDQSNCIEEACNFLPSHKCDEISEIQEVGKICLGQANGTCIKEACNKLPSYKCDEISEIQEVGKACKGSFSGDCLKEACNKLPSYKCDEISEIQEVGKACKGVASGCLEALCNKLPSHKCDEISEIQEVGKACSGS